MMTQAQEIKIRVYEKQFKDNLDKYSNWGSAELCAFGIYKSTNPNDKNITLIITTITSLSDDFQAFTATNNIMIEPDGSATNLIDIYPKEFVLGYIKELKKIN